MSEVFRLEKMLAEGKEAIELRDAVLRLRNNRDFKKIIEQNYFLTEAARLVQFSVNPAANAETRADSVAMAQATGHLKNYLSVICQRASQYENNREEIEEMLAEARVEEGGAA